MITMFQVNHREDPPPVLLLQHVLNEGQRMAVMLRLLVNHKPPLSGHLLGDDKARGGPFGVARLKPACLDEFTEDLLHGLLPLASQGKFPVSVHTGVRLQPYLGLTIRSTHRRGEHRLSAEEGITILLLQPGPQCLDLGSLIGLRLGFSGHLNHGAYLRGSYSARLRLRRSSQVAQRAISGLASEQVTVGWWVTAEWLVLAGHVVQHPPYEGIPIIGTRDDGVHLPPGFVLALALTLASPVVKGLIHIPLNQVQLLFTEEVLRFSDVNRENRKALPPGLRYDAVDTHEVGVWCRPAEGPHPHSRIPLAISGVAWAVP